MLNIMEKVIVTIKCKCIFPYLGFVHRKLRSVLFGPLVQISLKVNKYYSTIKYYLSLISRT